MGDENFYDIPDMGNTIIIFYVICIFGAISQVLLITAFIKDPLNCFKKTGTYLIKNLAVSDFLACLFASISRCVPRKWYWGLQFAMWSSIEVSILTIASISFDRFLMVVYPLKYRVFMQGKVVLVWLVCIWLFGSAFPMKAFLVSTGNSDPVIMNILETAFILFANVMYGFTYYKLTRQSENFALINVSSQQHQARATRDKRLLRTIILVACIAFACTVPSSILIFVLQKVFINGRTARILDTISTCVFFVNFAVNPLVYVLRLPNYRKTFYLLYCCKASPRTVKHMDEITREKGKKAT